jgi:hypothetical protein
VNRKIILQEKKKVFIHLENNCSLQCARHVQNFSELSMLKFYKQCCACLVYDMTLLYHRNNFVIIWIFSPINVQKQSVCNCNIKGIPKFDSWWHIVQHAALITSYVPRLGVLRMFHGVHIFIFLFLRSTKSRRTFFIYLWIWLLR